MLIVDGWSIFCFTVARQLYTIEEVLSRSTGPANVLRLSFRERKKHHHDVDRHKQVEQVSSHKQQNIPPVAVETAPTTGDD